MSSTRKNVHLKKGIFLSSFFQVFCCLFSFGFFQVSFFLLLLLLNKMKKTLLKSQNSSSEKLQLSLVTQQWRQSPLCPTMEEGGACVQRAHCCGCTATGDDGPWGVSFLPRPRPGFQQSWPLQLPHCKLATVWPEQQARKSVRRQAFPRWQVGAGLGWSLCLRGPAKQSQATRCGTQRGWVPRCASWRPRLEGHKGSTVREAVSTWKGCTSSGLTFTPCPGLPRLPRGPVPGRECLYLYQIPTPPHLPPPP